ncbi:hypothetical protein VNO78_18098 [Psophocarpus tetragonolobus]|uniref:Uncharacterized protein n=1 Tax=Psophocarpus tetragonolobus TaxID=3891 RepID=A0AAN9SIQ7_PSOTE
MQPRVAEATRRASWAVCPTSLKRGFWSGTRSRTADPEIHSGEQEAGPKVHRGQPQGISKNDNAKNAETEHKTSKAGQDMFMSKSPSEASPKLKSTGVNQRLDPSIQQKREQGSKSFEEVTCAAFDASPFPEDQNKGKEDDTDYYKHHKASPLSEIQFLDSRKPISRASHNTKDSPGGLHVVGWLPEQLETAEETLIRAAERWRLTAMRGDPDAPHSRRLRALRGEHF